MIPNSGHPTSAGKVENSDGVKPAGSTPQDGRPAVPKLQVAAPGSGSAVASVPPLKRVQVPPVSRIPIATSKKLEASNGVKPAGGLPQDGRPAVPKLQVAAPGISGSPVTSVPAPLKRAPVPPVSRIPVPPAGERAGETRPGAVAAPKRPYTVTPAVIVAHKASAAKSTGPKTEAGKEASSHGAAKHRLTARKASIVVDAEDQPAYDQSVNGLRQDYPRVEGSARGEFLLEMLAQIQWKLLLHFPSAESAAIRQARQWHADADRAVLEEVQRRVAQDEHDELVAYRLTAGGLDQLYKAYSTDFSEQVICKSSAS